MIPIVIGTSGAAPRKLDERLESIGKVKETKIDELQKSVIMNS